MLMGGGVSADIGVDFELEDNVCTDPSICPHPYLHNWDGLRKCTDCGYNLNVLDDATKKWMPFGATDEERDKNQARIVLEEELESNTPYDELSLTLDPVEMEKHVGKQSALRGVKLGLLVFITRKFNLWKMNSWEVIRKLIKPLTKRDRCRFTELSFVQPYVGQADTFVSYAQAGVWGDLIAALLDGNADLDRMIWLDVCAIRQWPNKTPDLDFQATIANCSSFIIVCSSIPQIGDMSWRDMKLPNIDWSLRRMICFSRVWCLVEAHQACSMPDIPIIMKCGNYKLKDSCSEGSDVEFESDIRMLYRLITLVDIEQAEATVQSDRERILTNIRNGVGIQKLNSVIRGACRGAYSAHQQENGGEIACAACGDPRAVEKLMNNINIDSICEVCSLGFLALLKKMLESAELDAESCVCATSAVTPLHAAAYSGHLHVVKFLREKYSLELNSRDHLGWTPLNRAAYGGFVNVVSYLLDEGADMNTKHIAGGSPIHNAAEKGHIECVMVLHKRGAKLDVKDDNEDTPLTLACVEGHRDCVEYMLTHSEGLDVHMKNKAGATPFLLALENGHNDVVELFVAKYDSINLENAEIDAVNNALINSAKNGYVSSVKYMINSGGSIVDINAKDWRGKTALDRAVECGHMDVVEFLQHVIEQNSQ